MRRQVGTKKCDTYLMVRKFSKSDVFQADCLAQSVLETIADASSTSFDVS